MMQMLMVVSGIVTADIFDSVKDFNKSTPSHKTDPSFAVDGLLTISGGQYQRA
jgi:hypothetical protein